MIQLPTTQLIHLQNTFTKKYIDINLHLDNTVTASYDYSSTQKSVTFTKDSMTQAIEVPIYDDSYKESDETFWLTPVSTSGYNEAMYLNNRCDEKYHNLSINLSENFKKQDTLISIIKKVV